MLLLVLLTLLLLFPGKMYWNATVGCKPVPPPPRRLSEALNSLVDDDPLPAVVMSSVWGARASAMREAATEELDSIQKQMDYEIQSARNKMTK